MSHHHQSATYLEENHTDALVIGAGFAGVRMLIELRRLGLSAAALEAGSDLGGTWYWNRYPGARTDSEAWSYAFPFEEIEQAWDWSERYPGQPEAQRYIGFVADHFDVRRDIRFNQRVIAASYDEAENRWTISTQDGNCFTCTYFFTALGHLTVPNEPEIPGRDSFTGETYLTSRWPHEKVDFTGKRVAVVGVGASGIQAIPHIAREAEHLTVFQRTPNYVMPAQNHDLDDEFRRQIKKNSAANWAQAKDHIFGFPMPAARRSYDDVSCEDERERIFEEGWQKGGFHFVFETFDDLVLDQRSNDAAAEFIRRKINEIVEDPETAELLTPRGYPYISKRPPSGTNYYETFNRDNVSLVDVRSNPIEALTPTGLRTAEQNYEFDAIVFATGFDASTGAFEKMDIRGIGGAKLSDAWSAGPRTHLGIGTPGFPNMFMVCGPQSPYINVPVAIEQIVEWLGEALSWLKRHDYDRMEATPEATARWTSHVAEIFDATLLPGGEAVNSWYLGANIPGKPRQVLFHFGGAGAYAEALDQVALNDFAGFALSRSRAEAEASAG